MKNARLNCDSILTKALNKIGVGDINNLIAFVKNIPYGRTTNRFNLLEVIIENRGTCSSKHALIKAVATENGISNIKLILCMYKMTVANTPGIGDGIDKSILDYIPEAHCFIEIGNQKLDLTNPNADLDRIKHDILSEVEIEPYQVGDYKIDYHKCYIANWIKDNSLDITLSKVWAIREECIANLSHLRINNE